jgi:hypothetical protein
MIRVTIQRFALVARKSWMRHLTVDGFLARVWRDLEGMERMATSKVRFAPAVSIALVVGIVSLAGCGNFVTPARESTTFDDRVNATDARGPDQGASSGLLDQAYADAGACCFGFDCEGSDSCCLDLRVDDCVAAGGVPLGPNVWCERGLCELIADIIDPDLPDTDGDGIPNEEDPDIDGDGIENGEDDDVDGDGIPNESDDDIDGDGVDNDSDDDDDGDGIDDDADDDDDADGEPDDDDDSDECDEGEVDDEEDAEEEECDDSEEDDGDFNDEDDAEEEAEDDLDDDLEDEDDDAEDTTDDGQDDDIGDEDDAEEDDELGDEDDPEDDDEDDG